MKKPYWMTIKITAQQAECIMFHGGAVCTVCKSVDEYANTETDAAGDECPVCEQLSLYGGEQALALELVEIA